MLGDNDWSWFLIVSIDIGGKSCLMVLVMFFGCLYRPSPRFTIDFPTGMKQQAFGLPACQQPSRGIPCCKTEWTTWYRNLWEARGDLVCVVLMISMLVRIIMMLSPCCVSLRIRLQSVSLSGLQSRIMNIYEYMPIRLQIYYFLVVPACIGEYIGSFTACPSCHWQLGLQRCCRLPGVGGFVVGRLFGGQLQYDWSLSLR